MKRLLSGDEAVARGAWDAGSTVGAGYPGTPSTEILESYAKYPGVYAEWAPNEKVAMDVAIGAAYAGSRAFSTMKHVGVNVAADSLFYASITGIEAGLVFVSADDPGMHSSQNEQDNRQYAKFARIPCLDPSDSQDAYEFTKSAFEISEQFDTPVLIRLTTRVCHTSTLVEISDVKGDFQKIEKYPRNPQKYAMIPGNARRRRLVVEKRIQDLANYSENLPINIEEMRSSELGIVTGGIAYQYAREVFPDASTLKLGMVFPLPRLLIRNFAEKVKKIIVLEELDPFIEEQVLLMGIQLFTPEGVEKSNYPESKAIFTKYGELNPSVVMKDAVKAKLIEGVVAPDDENDHNDDLPVRPPVLCPGCPHRSTFYILHKMGLPVNGDIGCYSLGITPPLSTTDTIGCMGASIGVAHGAAVSGDRERHIAVIGDSTFFHSGIQPLINVITNKSNVITVIMDNEITGMTGHQDNPGTGITLQNKETTRIKISQLVRALGFKKIKEINAYDVKAIEATLKDWVKEDEPAVLIVQEECALLPTAKARWLPLRVDNEICNGCTICFRIGCPAIIKSIELDPKYNRSLALIDENLCTGCEICAQVCPRNAILFRNQVAGEKGK